MKEDGGLTVSFNGNSYAIREAEIAVLSGNTIATSVLAEAFCRLGKASVIEMAGEWTPTGLKRYCTPSALRKRMLKLYACMHVETITTDNKERLRKQSSAFRRTVRGEAIGKLG